LIFGGRWVEAELRSQELELMSLEVVDRYPAPALGGADHGGEGELKEVR
jgi:hypothetical protein